MPQGDGSNRNAVLQLAATRALLLSRGRGAAIALREQGAMVCRASIGGSAPPVGCRLDLSSGFSGECVRTGRVLRCDDTETDERVDRTTCRTLGIRSILAVPIVVGREVVGLLEVFSPEAFAFDEECLALVERLAPSVLPVEPSARRISPPKLLIEREPWPRVFFRNLWETVFPPRLGPLRVTSLPARFWPDVFLPSRLPWERILQSMLLHVIAVAGLASGMGFLQFRGNTILPARLSQADVVYYSPDESLHAIVARGPLPEPAEWRQPPFTRHPTVVVARETESQAPLVALKPEAASLSLLAWNSLTPIQPLMATAEMRLDPGLALIAAVAPAAEVGPASMTRFLTGLNPVAVVGPPAEISAMSRARAPFAPPEAVVGPPPSLGEFVRRTGRIDIGQREAVGPAPQIPSYELRSSGVALAALHGTVNPVVPPPPLLGGVDSPGARSAALPMALPSPVLRGASDPTPTTERGRRQTQAHAVRPQSGYEQAGLENSRELSVNVVGLALTLASSSYFSSREVFLAEDRFSRHGSRLIKLVYEFLPYQPRLSDYGPNYAAVDRLRVTRDPNCDESLRQVLSSAHPFTDQLRQDLKGSNWQANTLECYRTTADDYRRAREHH